MERREWNMPLCKGYNDKKVILGQLYQPPEKIAAVLKETPPRVGASQGKRSAASTVKLGDRRTGGTAGMENKLSYFMVCPASGVLQRFLSRKALS
jgi:hypothetical protein